MKKQTILIVLMLVLLNVPVVSAGIIGGANFMVNDDPWEIDFEEEPVYGFKVRNQTLVVEVMENSGIFKDKVAFKLTKNKLMYESGVWLWKDIGSVDPCSTEKRESYSGKITTRIYHITIFNSHLQFMATEREGNATRMKHDYYELSVCSDMKNLDMEFFTDTSFNLKNPFSSTGVSTNDDGFTYKDVNADGILTIGDKKCHIFCTGAFDLKLTEPGWFGKSAKLTLTESDLVYNSGLLLQKQSNIDEFVPIEGEWPDVNMTYPQRIISLIPPVQLEPFDLNYNVNIMNLQMQFAYTNSLEETYYDYPFYMAIFSLNPGVSIKFSMEESEKVNAQAQDVEGKGNDKVSDLYIPFYLEE